MENKKLKLKYETRSSNKQAKCSRARGRSEPDNCRLHENRRYNPIHCVGEHVACTLWSKNIYQGESYCPQVYMIRTISLRCCNSVPNGEEERVFPVINVPTNVKYNSNVPTLVTTTGDSAQRTAWHCSKRLKLNCSQNQVHKA